MKNVTYRMNYKFSSIFFYSIIITLFLSGNLTQAQTPDWLRDITHDAGLDSAKGSRVLCFDINNDNYPDLMWGTGNVNKNRFYLFLNLPDPENPGKRKYVDFTKESNINQNRDPNKLERFVDIAAFADVDNDGDLDMVSSIYYHRWEYFDTPQKDHGDRSEVLLNDGTGKFSLVQNSGLTDIIADTAMPAGIINSTGLAFLDYDYDGKIDLYISTWYSDFKKFQETGNNNYNMPDILLKGNGNGTFTKVQNNGLQIAPKAMYGVNVTDWNNDGWQDILTCAYCTSSGSLFKNNKDGTFTDYTIQSGYSGSLMKGAGVNALCNWEAQPGDFDNDGDMDLLQVQVHGGYGKDEGRTHITINKGESENYKLVWEIERIRRDAPISTHIGDDGGTWIDIDGDTRLDIAIGQTGYGNINTQGQNHLYICRQNDTAYFDDITKALGLFYSMQESHSMEPCDFDLDGDQDLVVSHQVKDSTGRDTIIDGVTKKIYTYYNRMQVSLLRNDIGNKNNWISVKLDQPEGANKAGLGSRVRVFSNGVNQIRELQAGIGHFAGMQPFITNFGLKNHNYIDSIIVTWPHKTEPKTVIYNPPMNSIVEIDKNGLKPAPVKNWTDTKPVIACSKPFINFRNIKAGTTVSSSINIQNIGDSELEISKVVLKGSNSTYYNLINILDGSIIKPGENKELQLNFTPEKRDYYDAIIEITSNAFNQPVKLVDIYSSGFEEKPIIAYDKIEINMDSVFSNKDTKKFFTIFNKGEQTLTVTNLIFDNNTKNAFYLINPEKSFDIPAAGSRQVEIGFKPNEQGKWTEPLAYNATLKIESNAYNTDTNQVKFTGYTNGPAPKLELSPGTIFYGTVSIGNSIDRKVEITNPGNSSLIIYDIEIEENTDSAYIISGITFPHEVVPGSVIEFTISFNPKKAEKMYLNAQVYSNAHQDSIQTISLRGTGREPENVVDYSNDGSVLIIPNPASGNAELEFNVDININSIEILVLSGNIVHSINNPGSFAAGDKLSIDLASIYTGSYLLVMKCGNINKILPLKVIK